MKGEIKHNPCRNYRGGWCWTGVVAQAARCYGDRANCDDARRLVEVRPVIHGSIPLRRPGPPGVGVR